MASKRPRDGDRDEPQRKRTRREGEGEGEGSRGSEGSAVPTQEESPTNTRGTSGTAGPSQEEGASNNSRSSSSTQVDHTANHRSHPPGWYHPNSPIRMQLDGERVLVTEYELDEHGNLMSFKLPEGYEDY